MTFSREELLICAIARMLEGCRNIAVGAVSPIPGSAALLVQALSNGRSRASILGSNVHNPFNDGGPELFDRAGQGRVDAFFLGGGQIDGEGNINLVSSRRVLVKRVDFISAPGWSPPGLHRPGGPYALITSLCIFMYDRGRHRFRLDGLLPGCTLEEVYDNTAFEFDCPDTVELIPDPETDRVQIIRDRIAGEIAETYPQFARKRLNWAG